MFAHQDLQYYLYTSYVVSVVDHVLSLKREPQAMDHVSVVIIPGSLSASFAIRQSL